MKNIGTVIILETGTLNVKKRFPQITEKTDGSLWYKTTPVTRKDGAPVKMGVNGDIEVITQAELDGREKAAWAARPAVEVGCDAVLTARAQADAAEHASYYDPARICAARNRAEKAYQEWSAEFPAAAAAKIAEAAREKAAREAKVRNSDGYRAAIEGRD
jgi:hypothetical protein